jgi:hypothetical protein
MDREKYLLAKKNGLLERFRGDEISRRIAKEYPLSAQIALLMDKEDKPDEWNAYQAFRSQVKSEVDAEISMMEGEQNETQTI